MERVAGLEKVYLPSDLAPCCPSLGANGQVTYGGISGESFSLDPDTGVLTTLRALDREEQEEINLTGTHRQDPKSLRWGCKHQCYMGRTPKLPWGGKSWADCKVI